LSGSQEEEWINKKHTLKAQLLANVSLYHKAVGCINMTGKFEENATSLINYL